MSDTFESIRIRNRKCRYPGCASTHLDTLCAIFQNSDGHTCGNDNHDCFMVCGGHELLWKFVKDVLSGVFK